MAGHSKWKNIQHRKGRQDARRAKIFTKISKEIFVAVKVGGDDPTQNTSLRLALSKAKDANMPNDNIERTVKKAKGDVDGVTYEESVYEGYAPHGVALLVEVLTDNRNRTVADVRHLFNKHNGNLGESGCVAYLFERKGVLTVEKEKISLDEDDFMMEALEAGAEDVEVENEGFYITTTPEEYEAVKAAFEQQGIEYSSSELTKIPATSVELTEAQTDEVWQLIDALEDLDDVQNVYSNIES